MTKFSFCVINKGTPEQVIDFWVDGGEHVFVPVPNEVFSEDPEEGFRQRYAILVREGLIEDITPVWIPTEATPEDSTQPPNNET